MLRIRPSRGLAATALAAGAAVLAVLAAAPAGHAAPRFCRAADLSASLSRFDAGAGQRFATLALRNTSGSTCRTSGYVGMQLRDAAGHVLPTHVVRVRHNLVHTVLVQPDDHAFTRLRWGAIPTGGEPQSGPCEPAPKRLRVTPPDETHQVSTAWKGGPVCDSGRIETEPLHDHPLP